jgi:C1A family cysteine protease
MTKHHFCLGWQRDLPDQRDLLYSAPLAKLKALPAKIDLRKGCPPVYDQGHLGSCTANAIAGAVQFDRRKAKLKPDFVPSRLFIYYNERVIEHSIHYDAGAQLRDGIKSVAKKGVCPEKEWPYVDTAPPTENAPFPPRAPAGQRPPTKCYNDAKKYTAVSYQRLQQTLSQMKGCLADSYPFVFYMPYAYLTDASLASDLWTVRGMSG